MHELLGVIDALEAAISDSKRIPLTGKIAVDEGHILAYVDKLRFLAKNMEKSAARDAVDQTKRDDGQPTINAQDTQIKTHESPESFIENLIVEAKQNAFSIKSGANEYADNVLAKLQLLVTKMQKNLIRLERNIDEGRSMIEEKQKHYLTEEDPETDEIIQS
ncbi:MAG: hypothetical protein O3A01_09025 [bacterium]|nr:hypothetical protein [bacterium]